MMELEFTEERDKELRAAEKRVMEKLGSNASYTSRKRIIELIMQEPAPRFYISKEEAGRVISSLAKGHEIRRKGTRLGLCKELYKVFLRLKVMSPDADRSFLLEMAINSPASGFFLTFRTIQIYLYR